MMETSIMEIISVLQSLERCRSGITVITVAVALLWLAAFRVKHAHQPVVASCAAWLRALVKRRSAFMDYQIWGRVTADSHLKSKLMDALAHSIGELGKNEAVPDCFIPRHGMRAVSRDKFVDALICFECGQMITYISQGAGKAGISKQEAAIFNNALRAA